MGKQKNNRLYTVYNNYTDLPVCIDATAIAAANAMGVKMSSFWSILSHGGGKWYVEKRCISLAKYEEVRKQELSEKDMKYVGYKRNVPIEYQGESMLCSKWAERFGLNPNTVYKRIYKLHWSAEKAFTTPTLKRGEWDRNGRKNGGKK